MNLEKRLEKAQQFIDSVQLDKREKHHEIVAKKLQESKQYIAEQKWIKGDSRLFEDVMKNFLSNKHKLNPNKFDLEYHRIEHPEPEKRHEIIVKTANNLYEIAVAVEKRTKNNKQTDEEKASMRNIHKFLEQMSNANKEYHYKTITNTNTWKENYLQLRHFTPTTKNFFLDHTKNFREEHHLPIGTEKELRESNIELVSGINYFFEKYYIFNSRVESAAAVERIEWIMPWARSRYESSLRPSEKLSDGKFIKKWASKFPDPDEINHIMNSLKEVSEEVSLNALDVIYYNEFVSPTWPHPYRKKITNPVIDAIKKHSEHLANNKEYLNEAIFDTFTINLYTYINLPSNANLTNREITKKAERELSTIIQKAKKIEKETKEKVWQDGEEIYRKRPEEEFFEEDMRYLIKYCLLSEQQLSQSRRKDINKISLGALSRKNSLFLDLPISFFEPDEGKGRKRRMNNKEPFFSTHPLETMIIGDIMNNYNINYSLQEEESFKEGGSIGERINGFFEDYKHDHKEIDPVKKIHEFFEVAETPEEFFDLLKVRTKYNVIRKLGEGNNAKTFLVYSKELDQYRALKIIMEDVHEEEAKNMASFEGEELENIAKIYEAGKIARYAPEKRFSILMEYVDGKTLQEIVNEEELSSEKVLDYSSQLHNGIRSLQKRGITHYDIHLDNIKINSKGVLKILDFGTSSENGETSAANRLYGPPKNKKEAGDIFSLALITYTLDTKKSLVDERNSPNTDEYKNEIAKAKENMYLNGKLKQEYKQKIKSNVSEPLQEIIITCLENYERLEIIEQAYTNAREDLKYHFMEKSQLIERIKELEKKLPEERNKGRHWFDD